MSPQAEWVCHSLCGEPAAWRGHSSSRKQQPGTRHSFCLLLLYYTLLLLLCPMYYVVVIYYHPHHHNDRPPSCSQRREPPSCNLLELLHPGIVGQGGPLCRICTWFNICTFWSHCISLNSHPVSQHPKRSFWSTQFWPPAGGVNIRMGQTFGNFLLL